nr:hypothetical protein CFP56_36126 [Quercus suber]
MRKQPQNRIRIPKTNPRSRSLPLKNQHEAFHANQGRHILPKRHERGRTESNSEIRSVPGFDSRENEKEIRRGQ